MSATYDIGRHCDALKPAQIASSAGSNHRLLQLDSLKLFLAAHQDIYLSEALPTPPLCVIAGLSAVALPFLLPGPSHLVWAPSRSPREKSVPLIADMRGRNGAIAPCLPVSIVTASFSVWHVVLYVPMQPKSGVQDIAAQFAEFCRSCDARSFQQAMLLSWWAAVLWLTVHRHVVLALSREGKQHGCCGRSSGSDDVQRPAVPAGHEVLVVLVQADDCRHYQRMHSVDLLRSRVVTLLHCKISMRASVLGSAQCAKKRGIYGCLQSRKPVYCMRGCPCLHTHFQLPLEMSTMRMRFSPLMG